MEIIKPSDFDNFMSDNNTIIANYSKDPATYGNSILDIASNIKLTIKDKLEANEIDELEIEDTISELSSSRVARLSYMELYNMLYITRFSDDSRLRNLIKSVDISDYINNYTNNGNSLDVDGVIVGIIVNTVIDLVKLLIKQ